MNLQPVPHNLDVGAYHAHNLEVILAQRLLQLDHLDDLVGTQRDIKEVEVCLSLSGVC